MNDDEDLIYDQTLLLRKETKHTGYSKWCQKFSKTLCLSLAFFTLGLCIAIPGPTLLDLGDRVNTDTTHMALIFSARSVGYLLGALVGGFLFDIFDKQLLLTVTLFLASVATVIIPWAATLVILAVMFSLQGVAMGLLDTGGNVFCVRLWGGKSPPYMQALHFAFGIGAFIAPLIAQPFLSSPNLNTTSPLQGNIPIIKSGVILHYNDSEHGRFRRDNQDGSWIDINSYLANSHSSNILIRRDTTNESWIDINSYVNASTSNISLSGNAGQNDTVSVITTSTTTSQPPPIRHKPSITNAEFLPDTHRDGSQVKTHLDTNKIIDDMAGEQPPEPPPNTPNDGGDESKQDTKRLEPNETLSDFTGSALNTSVKTNQANTINENVTSTIVLSNTSSISTTTPKMNKSTPISFSVPPTTTTHKPTTSTITPSTTTPTTPTTTPTPTTSTTTPTTATPKPTPSTTTLKPSTSTTSPKTTHSKTSTHKVILTPTHKPTTVTSSPATSKDAEQDHPGQITDESNSNETTTMLPSTTKGHKPTETKDLFDSVISQIKNMSRIQFAYSIIALLLFVNSTLFLVSYCLTKRKPDAEDIDDYREMRMHEENNCVRMLTLVFSFFFFFCYVGMETTFGGLIMTFAVESAHWTKSQGAIVTAIFWGSLAVGRGFAIFISNCCAPRTMLIIDLVFMMIGSLILAFGVQPVKILLWLGTVFLGIGLSSVFPTSVTWIEQYFKITGKSTAVFVTGSAIGQMTLPVATGYLYENYDKLYLMYIVAVLGVLMVVFYIIMQCLASRSSRTVSGGFLRLDDLDTDVPAYSATNDSTTRHRKHMPVHNGYDLLMQDAEDEF